VRAARDSRLELENLRLFSSPRAIAHLVPLDLAHTPLLQSELINTSTSGRRNHVRLRRLCILPSGYLRHRAATGQPSITGKIAPPHSRLANIVHLRTLSSQLTGTQTSAPPLSESKPRQVPLEDSRRASYSPTTESDDFSLWSDTGDIAEQLTNEEDPLRIELDPLNEQGKALDGGGGRKQRRVHYRDEDHLSKKVIHPGIDKEAIPIPKAAPRRIRKFERLLAILMAPNDPQTAKTKGLVGKPLL
jgi:hypothetical protein